MNIFFRNNFFRKVRGKLVLHTGGFSVWVSNYTFLPRFYKTVTDANRYPLILIHICTIDPLRVHFSKDVVLLVKLCEFRRLTCLKNAKRISSAMRTLTDCRSTCKRSFCSQTRFRGLFLQETPSGRTLRHREHSNLASRLVSHRGSNTGLQRWSQRVLRTLFSNNKRLSGVVRTQEKALAPVQWP